MNSSISLLQHFAPVKAATAQTKIKTAPRKVLTTQKVSALSSGIGVLLCCLFQQATYATVPLTLHALVVSEVQRRRTEVLQQNEQQQQKSIIEIQQQSQDLNNDFKQVQQRLAQAESLSQKYLTRIHLTPLISKSHQIQRRMKTLELNQADTAQQIQQIQQRELTLNTPTREAELVQPRNVDASNGSFSSPTQQAKVPKKVPQRPKTDRVIIFIDQANLHCAARERGIKIDYARLVSLLKRHSSACQTIVYMATDSTNLNQKAFISYLKHQGFEIESKKMTRRDDGSTKGNLDAEIILGLINSVDRYDTAILISGDGDFVGAMQQSRKCGKRIEVASFRGNTSAFLIKAADSYLNLETVCEQICS
jgi:uncharacterized LabA/DUF88 family protein